MLKSLTVFFALLTPGLTSTALAGSDELFSDVSSRSVFDKVSVSKSGSVQSGRRILDADGLRELLKSAGFDAKATGSRAASAEKKLEPWTFPVIVVLSEDEATVTVVLGLSTIKDPAKELTSDRLLKMMATSQKSAPTMFLFNAGRQRTEVSRTMNNRNLTGDMLRREINRMAVLARDNADVWASSAQKAAIEPTPPVNSPTRTTPQTTPAPNLNGKWTATKSAKEAFGIEFSQDGTFNLVYVNNGTQLRSSGSFAVKESTLSLSGNDGLKLEGKLTVKSAQEFRFEPKGSVAMEFTKAN